MVFEIFLLNLNLNSHTRLRAMDLADVEDALESSGGRGCGAVMPGVACTEACLGKLHAMRVLFI